MQSSPIKDKNKLFSDLEKYIHQLDFKSISGERQQILQPLIDYIQSQKDANKIVNLNFICTHNSRRSHLSQVWAQTMAAFYNIKDVFCYSGGTEATALYKAVVTTLISVGFKMNQMSSGSNPIYSIKYNSTSSPIIGFSKTFDDAFNPESEFAAIMTCSSADEGCPFIPGAKKRIPITYGDPKAFDNTKEQLSKYEERSNQIASEMKYVFSKIK